MKKLFLLIGLMGIVATSCDDFLEEDYTEVHKIWYTSTDGKIVEPFPPVSEGKFGANILSNNYYGSQGIIKFDDEVTTIGASAFAKCGNLKSIILPNSVASIGGVAFINCGSLESITIPNGVTSIGEMAFKSCKSLKSITIPDGVTKIDSETFLECSSLESVSLGNGVTEIGYRAFRECSSLKSVVIPDNVTWVQQEAFIACKELETVTLGSGVTMIGIWAFASCSSLESVYCKATTPPHLETSGFVETFKGCASNCTFYVPTESVSAYKNDDDWRKYADNIVGYDF